MKINRPKSILPILASTIFFAFLTVFFTMFASSSSVRAYEKTGAAYSTKAPSETADEPSPAPASIPTQKQEGPGDIRLGDRHMIMLQPGIEQVVGSYMFGVTNSFSTPQAFKFELFMPKETVDFGPQDGLTPDDLVLSETGKVMVSKTFPPGLSIVSVGFLAKVEPGLGELKFSAPIELKELSFLASKDTLELKSTGMTPGVPSMLKDGRFDGIISTSAVAAGSDVIVTIGGLPQGRSDYINMGIVFSLALVLFSVGLAFLKRTKTTYQNEIDEVMEL